jgi:hypothetical protein
VLQGIVGHMRHASCAIPTILGTGRTVLPRNCNAGTASFSRLAPEFVRVLDAHSWMRDTEMKDGRDGVGHRFRLEI